MLASELHERVTNCAIGAYRGPRSFGHPMSPSGAIGPPSEGAGPLRVGAISREGTAVTISTNAAINDAADGATYVDHQMLVDWLSSPGTYGRGADPVETIETHISQVFLAGPFVYKLKKPVRFEFLDFSTPALRRLACQAEYRLNRRLAPDTYLGVLPITIEGDGHFALDGDGPVVDWVVKMRRLDTTRTLDRRIREGRLRPEHVARLARRLTSFYLQASPMLVRAEDYQSEVEHNVRANFEELIRPVHRLPPALVHRVASSQWRFLVLAPELLRDRVCDGRVIDGHGDLRPEHVVLDDDVVIFDCVEFNDELRRVDVADELAFLAMECDFLAADAVGDEIRQSYSSTAADRLPASLWAFYKSYRATVRAKVAALRSEQVEGAARDQAGRAAEEYLALADRYRGALGPPLLLVVRGRSGTGKTTLAEAMATRLAAERLSTDAIRIERFGPPAGTEPYGGGRYDDDSRRAVYEEMFRRAGRALADGLSVVLDGTFLAASAREEAVMIARRHGAVPLVVTCTCPAEVVRERIARRIRRGNSHSEAATETYEAQAAYDEPDRRDLPVLEVDSTESLAAQVASVVARLRNIASPALEQAAGGRAQ